MAAFCYLNSAGEGLSDALMAERGVTALVGGGGKTTTMLRLAGELRRQGTVIVTTSTHIWAPVCMPVLDAPCEAEIRSALQKSSAVCVGTRDAQGKLAPCAVDVEALAALADYVLVEADGAKGMPLKAPAAHEPVIPANASLVVAVAGVDGVSQTVGAAAFRPDLYADIIGASLAHIITPSDVAAVLTDVRGQYKGVSRDMRFAVVLNKADDAKRFAIAEEIAACLPRTLVARVVITENKERLGEC